MITSEGIDITGRYLFLDFVENCYHLYSVSRKRNVTANEGLFFKKDQLEELADVGAVVHLGLIIGFVYYLRKM